MRILTIETFLLEVPLKTPFVTALRRVDAVQDLVVRIELENGICGYGEAAPTLVISGDSLQSMQAVIHTVFKPLLVGQSMLNFQSLLHQVQRRVVANSSAKAALEIALYDARSQLLQIPLCQLLGAEPTTLTTDITVSMNPVDEMVTDALAAVAAGYQHLKIKLGSEPELDVERVLAIHRAMPSHIKLRLDVNQAWTAKQSIRALRQIEAAGILPELIEQPVPAADLAGLKAVKDAVLTPVMADESAYSPADVVTLLAQDCCDIINIKLMKTGGISAALQILALADVAGKPCMLGSMLESSISVAAAAHLAAAFPQTIRYLDLDGPTLSSFDPVSGGTRFEGPSIVLNQSSGLGIQAIRGLTPWPLAALPV
ncbi:dipeptide epimerase [Rheinheimera texasensis]|uniref:dipeptide epimerase n=1 Tax=Rheinheimera texasensis TaxID=306205 RepID=UPI0004E0D552|nr:dipeptide epimerase [Rheinheimera texasensis]